MDPIPEVTGAERELRLLSYVTRWQIVQRRREQSLADHQYHVALLCLRMLDELDLAARLDIRNRSMLTAAVLSHALTHDIPEIVTADIPSPANKAAKRSPQWTEWVNAATRRFLPWWGRHRTPMYKHVVDHLVGIVDLLEAWLHLQEERDMGNTYVVPHQAYIGTKLHDAMNAPWPDPGRDSIQALVRRWVEATIHNASNAPRVLT